MKKTYSKHRILLSLLLVVASGLAALYSTNAVSAAPTTWQTFVEKKCSGSSADAAASCATNLGNGLTTTCGAEKNSATYTACWRTFIKDNGGSVSANSSPFETKKAPNTPASSGCASVKTSVIKCSNTGGNPITALILLVVNFLSVGVGIAVVGGIVWGGFVYTQANGNSSKAQEGISIIINAVIGLVLYIGMYALVNFLVPGGLFS